MWENNNKDLYSCFHKIFLTSWFDLIPKEKSIEEEDSELESYKDAVDSRRVKTT